MRKAHRAVIPVSTPVGQYVHPPNVKVVRVPSPDCDRLFDCHERSDGRDDDERGRYLDLVVKRYKEN